MTKITGSIVAASLFIFIPIFLLCAQDAVPEHRLQVRQRLLPVMVYTPDGSPIRGLRAADFELFVDGRPVAIGAVDERDYMQTGATAGPGRNEGETTASNAPPRRFVLLFDSLSGSLQPLNRKPVSNSDFAAKSAEAHSVDDADPGPHVQRGIRWAKRAALAALDSLLPTDEVAVFEIGVGPRLIENFTADRGRLRRAIEAVDQTPNLTTIPMPMSGSTEQEIAAQLRDRLRQVKSYSQQMLSMYERLGEDLARLPGVKQVIVFSEGFPVLSDQEEFSITEINQTERMDHIASVLASSGARVSTVSTAGLDRAQMGTDEEATLATLAEDTGGAYFRPRGRIEAATREAFEGFGHYYEIFFAPPGVGDGKLCAVEVKVRRPDARVRAPKGYLDAGRFDQNADTRLQAAFDVANSQPSEGGAASATVGAALLPIAEGVTLLHLRAVLPPAPAGEKPVRIAVRLGRDNALYDEGEWRTSLDQYLTRQVDLLLAVPPGAVSWQFVAQDADGGGILDQQAGALTVPEHLTPPAIGPVYLWDPEGMPDPEPELLRAPETGGASAPSHLRALIGRPQLTAVLPGQEIGVGFVFAGFEADALDFYFSGVGGELSVPGKFLERTALSDGLAIWLSAVIVPELAPGEYQLVVIARVGERRIHLATEQIAIGEF